MKCEKSHIKFILRKPNKKNQNRVLRCKATYIEIILLPNFVSLRAVGFFFRTPSTDIHTHTQTSFLIHTQTSFLIFIDKLGNFDCQQFQLEVC